MTLAFTGTINGDEVSGSVNMGSLRRRFVLWDAELAHVLPTVRAILAKRVYRAATARTVEYCCPVQCYDPFVRGTPRHPERRDIKGETR